MCLALNLTPDGLAPCRKCWQCRLNRVNDLVGRCIAESLHSSKTIAVTLTYGGGDHPHAYVLVYADVQRAIKRLRTSGYKVRYIVVGEYGSKGKRAHWHAILFFEGKAPNYEQKKRIILPWWRHGHAYVDQPSYEAFRYVLKYVLKGQEGEVKVSHLAMSKKPPLGDAFVRELARKHVAQGLVPTSAVYKFTDQFKANGERRKFHLKGKSLDNFCKYFTEEWARQRPKQEIPHSEFYEEYEDLEVRRSIARDPRASWQDFLKHYAAKQHWTQVPDLARFNVKIIPTDRLGLFVAKTEDSDYIAIQFSEGGTKLWQSALTTRGAIRRAIRGQLVAPQQR